MPGRRRTGAGTGGRGVDPSDLDEFNPRLGAALIADGRVYAGPTVYAGQVTLRPAIVDTFVDVLHQLIDDLMN
jgi:hypothetical protein